MIAISVDRFFVVGDLFDSFHAVQEARSELKEKGYEAESIFEFVQLTAQDDMEARSNVLKDLGFRAKEIEFLDEALGKGRIFLCVDSLEEQQCEKVEKILIHCGSLEAKNKVSSARSRTARPKKVPAKRIQRPEVKEDGIEGRIEL